ncbi:unnamed protein product [Musa acuminata subsp. burmannicoides]
MVEDGGDLLELGDGELGDVAAVELRRDESLQGAELRHRRLPLERHPLVHLRALTRSTAIIALSFQEPKAQSPEEMESGGRSGTRNANRTATFPSDGSDYISSLVMVSPRYVRAFCHQVVQPDLLLKRNGLYALNGGGIWNPMLDWEDRRR